ncbi:energy transducer TonB [Algibacter luteus]|uniref:Outer membrane transport energization protein TonB n=1 Tax=Algibacter luteus TaxID=1178825 RepID=A0A1M6A0N7_9FLAO|nr:energy transducer TonB [Algibacter luteus]WJJ97818.1 energy transducer TonB [Algibacter luteus]SHI30045.1 outer membrane transport energization protein TonB [Algibacter luteus]
MEAKKNPELEIGRNSGIYFAIGLNLMLLLSWRALEYRTYEQDDVEIGVVNMETQFEEEIPIVNANTPPPPPPPAVVQEVIQIVEDVEEVEETVIESTEIGQDDAVEERIVEVSDVEVEEVDEDVQVAFAIIEDVPVFPGCEGLSKQGTKDCFQKKIQEHVGKNFTYPQTALDLGIQGRVSVVFVIDKSGHITNIRSRGPDKILQQEAERIIGKLPKMKPGKQRGMPVKVAYAVPIFFKLDTGS